MQSAVFISKFIRHPEQNGVAQYWDWPSKKGARERTDMDWLKDILGDAHTEDIDNRCTDSLYKRKKFSRCKNCIGSLLFKYEGVEIEYRFAAFGRICFSVIFEFYAVAVGRDIKLF